MSDLVTAPLEYAGNLATAAIGVEAVNVLGNLEQVLFSAPRSIGTIIPDVTIEEHHSDRLVITEHPVEQGASITDHAYKRPAEVSMRVGWSNSSSVNQFGSEDYVRQVYDALIQLQGTRQPMTVMTGKRLYQTMLIESVDLENTAATEYSLFCNVRLKQIVIVSLQTAQIASSSAIASDPTNQAQPQNTNPAADAGSVQPRASLLSGTPGASTLVGWTGYLAQ